MSGVQERFEWVLARVRALGLVGASRALRTRLRHMIERNRSEWVGMRARYVAEEADLGTFRFLWDEDRLEPLLEACRRQGDALDSEAEDLLEGEVLGVQGPRLEAPFPWSRSPLDGSDLAGRGWLGVQIFGEAVAPGLRLVQETGKLRAVSLLAALSRIDRHPDRADRAFALLEDFAARNPYPLGPHWSAPEQVAARLVSLVWFHALMGTEAVRRRCGADFPRWIYEHQRFLRLYADVGLVRDWRRIVIAAAQLTTSLTMPWFPESPLWAARSREALEREVLEQFHPDGVGREQNAEAEACALEAVFLAVRVAEETGAALRPEVLARFERMAEYFVARTWLREPATRPGALRAGHLLGLPTAGNAHHESLRVALALHLDRPGWVRGTVQLDPQALLLLGDPEAAAVFDAWTADTMTEPFVPEEVFPEGGRFFFRSTQGAGLCLSLDAGNHGLGPCYDGAHADLLGISIEVGGRPVVADPGSCLVEPDKGWNEYLRSTGAHSTVRVNWESSSIPGPAESWALAADPRDRGYAVSGTGRLLVATAAHHGYQFQEGGVVHRRSVTRDHGDSVHLAIEDHLYGDLEDKVDFEILFHFHPRVAAIHQLRETYQVPCGPTTLCFRFCSDSPLDVRATKGHESPFLGWYAVTPYRVEPCWVLRVAGRERLPVTVRTAIFPT